MTQSPTTRLSVPPRGSALFQITVRTGRGEGQTLLSAFDGALQQAGVADFNLVTLSSVIPPSGRVVRGQGRLAGGHGDRLLCVQAVAYADHPGEHAWAGVGWVTDSSGKGLFVEHTGGSRETVEEQIRLSLADMVERRGDSYGDREIALATAHCVDRPVCAIALAAFQVQGWESA
ncbi:MAG: pyruvoyl-dependent arginine decarboxylase [Ornithinimicrobium sp.]